MCEASFTVSERTKNKSLPTQVRPIMFINYFGKVIKRRAVLKLFYMLYRWATERSLPARDNEQNVTPISGQHMNGVLTIVVSKFEKVLL